MKSNWMHKEKYIILHGQPKTFRIIKWILLIGLWSAVYYFFGWSVVLKLILTLVVIGTLVHVIFRWKTKAWTKNWGPYKVIKIPDEK